MSQDIFISSIGAEVTRISPRGEKTILKIKDYEWAKYLHSLQEHGFEFEFPKVANVCVSCEG